MNQNEVSIAFDILLEEIEHAIEILNQEGAKAFQRADYIGAKELMEKGSQMTAFREKVKDLDKEWTNIFAKTTARLRPIKTISRGKDRLRRGLRTPEDAYRVPILRSLIELGGSAEVLKVLDGVGRLMKSRVNSYDLSPLPSDPQELRWRNTAKWARNTLVKEGLLSADSPRGVWTITDAGRRWLAVETKRSD